MTPPLEMTSDMMIVFGFLIFVTILFVFEIVRVDMVGLLMMVLLPLSGVITASQAISGLSSNAVVSIIAVIIIGDGLDTQFGQILPQPEAQPFIVKVVGSTTHCDPKIVRLQ